MNLTKNLVGSRLTLKLAGRFDFSAHHVFRDTFKEAMADPKVAFVQIDLTAVDYINSSALGMLLLSRENAQAAGKSISLANPQGTVKDVLRIANFDRLFTIE